MIVWPTYNVFPILAPPFVKKLPPFDIELASAVDWIVIPPNVMSDPVLKLIASSVAVKVKYANVLELAAAPLIAPLTFKSLLTWTSSPTYKVLAIPAPPDTFNDPEYISLASVVVVIESELSFAFIMTGTEVLLPAAIFIDVEPSLSI